MWHRIDTWSPLGDNHQISQGTVTERGAAEGCGVDCPQRSRKGRQCCAPKCATGQFFLAYDLAGACFLRGLTIESQYGHLISSKVMRRICEGSISAWHFGQMRFRLARIASRLIFLRDGIRRMAKKSQRPQTASSLSS